jgi:hypothetical protein
MKNIYLNPSKVFKLLKLQITDLKNSRRYLNIVKSLDDDGKLQKIGFRADQDYNLYLGIDLNPELLLYSEMSQETAELKLIGEKLKRHTDFLLNEGILDSIQVDYDRVKDENFYGYIVKISYKFTHYTRKSYIKNIAYFLSIGLTSIGSVIAAMLLI